jgi:hypothetical protein
MSSSVIRYAGLELATHDPSLGLGEPDTGRVGEAVSAALR